MPKDWFRYKSEIENLYIYEGLPLRLVRTTLQKNHGFEASIRSYKTKLDEWQFRKNRKSASRLGELKMSAEPGPAAKAEPTTVLSPTTNLTPRPEPSTQDETLPYVDGSRGYHSTTSYLRILSDPELRANIPNASGAYPIESLLDNWYPDDKHLDLALSLLKKGAALMRPTSTGSCILDLIDSKVPDPQKSTLIKAVFENDIIFQPLTTHSSPRWAETWRAATKLAPWSDVYNIWVALKEWFQIPVLDCAFFVIAERLLKTHMNGIEALRAKRSLDIADTHDMKYHRRQYIAVFESLCGRLGPSSVAAVWCDYISVIRELEGYFHVSGKIEHWTVDLNGCI